MLGTKKVICIIPARLKSTRLPQKMLATLNGKPMIQWVWEAATAVSYFDTVAFAIDSKEIASVIDSFGGKYFYTSESCQMELSGLSNWKKKGASRWGYLG